MIRAYRYRLYPTDTQKVLLDKHFGCARWVYNWALAEKVARYHETGASVSMFELQRSLPELKRMQETEWLGEVSAQSLQCALHHLDQAFTGFFKQTASFPRFKSRHDNRHTFHNSSGTHVQWDTQRIRILKFQEGIKATLHRRFDGVIKTCAVSKSPSGKYHICMFVETPEIALTPPLATESSALGLDFGLKDLVVTSDGQRFANPKTLNRYLRRLQIRQRRMTKKVKGSKNRDKARLRVALVHERISNIRTDSLHKISAHLVRENQATTLCLEDLSINSMLDKGRSNKSLRRSISDAGWNELRRQLTYKAAWAGKNVRIIGRFEPSSKMCSKCGHINSYLKLSEREWTCTCGIHHDRDINAAINIKQMAFRTQDTSCAARTTSGRKASTYRGVTRKSTPKEQAARPAVSWEHPSRALTLVHPVTASPS